MDAQSIPYTQIPRTSRLFTDYLYDYGRVSEFFSGHPFEAASFRNAARLIEYGSELRQQVVAVLKEQNQGFSSSEKTFESLKKLERPGCYTVVTGQQMGLFSGPVFAFYKALTAIKLARSLSSRGLEAVPIFWLATEDHDLEEVNHCFVQDRQGEPRRLDYPEQPPIPGARVGEVRLTDTVFRLQNDLRGILPDSAEVSGVFKLLAECYKPGESYGTAFGRLMARLFRNFGVVLMDPMDRRLHKLSAPVFRAAIQSAPELQRGLAERNRRLTEGGYHIQVRVTGSSSLLFVQENSRRTAMRLQGGNFVSAQGIACPPEDLLARLEQQPENFSPNVLLRPVMQDALLPTVAYVSGPSELAYLAQAGSVYQSVLGRMPVVFPRASFTVLDRPATRLLRKYGLQIPDVYAGKQSLREKMAMRFLPDGLTALFQKASSELEQNLEMIRKALGQVDPTLVDAAAGSARKMQYQLSGLERKAAAAVQSRTEQVERDASKLENTLYPQKTLQERLFSGISFLAWYGPQFLDQIYEAIPLHSSDHQLLSL